MRKDKNGPEAESYHEILRSCQTMRLRRPDGYGHEITRSVAAEQRVFPF